MPQLISVPLPIADYTDAEGRRELLVRPARQLLHRQRVPALRREHLRPRDHGADRGRHVTHPRRPVAGRRTSAMASEEPHVQLTGVSKHFAGIRALDGVDFACRRGTIHAVLGENGAGKSTLIKIISGVLRPDTGEMRLAGRPVAFANPSEAARAGIVCIFQELSLIPDLTVADNISLSDPPKRLGLIDRPAQRRRAEALLARIKCEDINPRALVRDLSLSRRQMVEIAKAIGRDPSVLILDEATSALTSRDVETVYALLRDLKDQGVGLDLHLAPHARGRRALRHPLGLPQRPPHRDLRQGRPLGPRDRPPDDRPRRRGAVPAQARPPAPGAAAPRPRPRLGEPAQGRRHLGRPRRDRRPRRPRRPGPEGAAPRPLRRPARRRRRGHARNRPRPADLPGRGEVRQGPDRARPRGPQDRGPDAGAADRRQPARRLLRPGLARPLHRRGRGRGPPSTRA